MISFDVGKVRFNYKSSGIATDNGRVLLTTEENINFWYLPGGRVEALETTSEALRREMIEELDQTVEIGPLLWVVENFFNLQGTPFHEVAFFYSMNFTESPDIYQQENIFEGTELTTRLFFKWFNINELEDIELYPRFLRMALKNIPSITEHIVVRD